MTNRTESPPEAKLARAGQGGGGGRGSGGSRGVGGGGVRVCGGRVAGQRRARARTGCAAASSRPRARNSPGARPPPYSPLPPFCPPPRPPLLSSGNGCATRPRLAASASRLDRPGLPGEGDSRGARCRRSAGRVNRRAGGDPGCRGCGRGGWDVRSWGWGARLGDESGAPSRCDNKVN